MLLRHLSVRDFRNFAHADLTLTDGFTVLWGHNGAGKTALLEAIYLVSTLRSFRSSDLGPLVRHGTGAAAVELRGHDPTLGVSTTLEVRLRRHDRSTRRTASADGKAARSAADFYGRIRAVLFTPEDLGVLRGSPSARRQFLDRVLFARERAHIGDVQAYDKLVRSRNRVLKDEAAGTRAEREAMLDSYEAGLADVGARIWTRRVRLLDVLAEPFAAAFARIHGARGFSPEASGAAPPHAGLHYAAALGDIDEPQRVEALRRTLAERRREDERRGATSVGPHRDDLEVTLDDRGAADYASQGQSRALVLAFKLAEVAAARERLGAPPLLLLDDVSSELDPERSALLFRTLAADVGQCILTTTSRSYIDLPGHVVVHHHRVDRGTLSTA